MLVCALAAGTAGCAKVIVRPPAVSPARPATGADAAARHTVQGRPVVGVAFGGGSARGIAHVGVIRWFEEHRIPIDVAAGTSMGGLVGGAFATGMDADELDALLATMNWDELFGSSDFAFKNIRRKADARAFPSRIEFGLKGGITPPPALINGQQVELFLSRMTAAYHDVPRFDDLPTPFRAVTMDLVSATQVVLDRGSLATALRATMSLPLIFPPVEVDGRVLVDGGVMNNVPADVVRAMGADRVVAINVGELGARAELDYTMLGLVASTIDAMSRASTNRALEAADVIINVPLKEYGSLDWRRGAALVQEGYRAAEAMREALLPLAIGEDEYARWKAERQGRRRPDLPVPAFVEVSGLSGDDTRRLNAILQRHVGVPLDTARLQRDLAPLAGLDRYQTITWQLAQNDAGDSGLRVSAMEKPYAPPFLMLGLNLENTAASEFRITATARYLDYGLLTSDSELRVDGSLGTNPAAGAELYQPVGARRFFVAPYAQVFTSTFNVISNDHVLARYEQRFARAGASAGINLGARSDVRLGIYIGRIDASVDVGNPGFPAGHGSEAALDAAWRFDGQDSPVVPTGGRLSEVRWRYLFDRADLTVGEATSSSTPAITQLSGTVTQFWSVGERNRLFLYGGAGTSFDGSLLPPNQFMLGGPLRLGAYRAGELFGDHYYIGTGGYLRQLGRLPDFVGGPIFAGAWLENGDAFDDWNRATWKSNASLGVIMETLVGPVLFAGSGGFDGGWKLYVGVGRLFR